MTADNLIEMQQRINDMYARIEALGPVPQRIALTGEQIDALRAAVPVDNDPSPMALLCGIPIERVDSVEESTPYLDMVAKAEVEGFRVVGRDGLYFAVKVPEPFQVSEIGSVY